MTPLASPTLPANDNPAGDIAVQAALDILKERMRLAAGGAAPTAADGARALLVYFAARAILLLEAHDLRIMEIGR